MKKIMTYKIEHIGVQHPDYFQGRGTSFTSWDSVYVGIGNDAKEALDDALENLSSDYEILPALENELKNPDMSTETVPEEYDESYFYVAVWVRTDELKVTVWEERDRLHIHLFRGDENNTIAEWWDDTAREMFHDGFFKPGKGLEKSVIEYAQSINLI